MKKDANKLLTLVLDLDETLVHFSENDAGGEFFVRPFASEFLELMSERYEIVVFTAATQEYADWILNPVDANHCVSHRLYRTHAETSKGFFYKDLSKLGRDLSKVIIVDNDAENFQFQPENGIYIKSWYDDPNDIALKQLSKILGEVAEKPNEVCQGFPWKVPGQTAEKE